MCCSLLRKDLLEFIPECAAFPQPGIPADWWSQSPLAVPSLFGFITPISAILDFLLAGNTAVLLLLSLPVYLLRRTSCVIVCSCPTGLCSMGDPTVAFPSGKVSSHRTIFAKPHAWPLCTHAKGKNALIFHVSRRYGGAWLTFSLFTEPGEAYLN